MNLKINKWKQVKLGDICTLEYGNTLKEQMRNGGSVPVYGSAGIIGWHDSALTTSPSLIIARKGSIGNVFYSVVPCFPIDTVYYIEERQTKESLNWLKIVLRHYDLKKLNMATAIPGISRNVVYQISIPLPSESEQTQIAELFQSIETAIEQAEQQEKNLLKLKKTLSNGLLSKEPEFGNLLSKENCTPTNFGGVADCIEQHDKQKKDVSRFIGLENIEPEDLSISTWGNIANGTTFTKRFSKGDVLFGKRRAYLKKVAIAAFDGICSGDILVLRAKEKKMLQELLPFYVSAEEFIQHAISTSAGSLSPRTKWKDLSLFEISIPDLKTQKIILEVFQQIEKILLQLKTQKQTLKNLKQKLLNEILG